ncbi:DUF4268 domain-containing protein [Prolixibacter denitrificans]|uniref:Uncharacterized protein DUF4268 n=1 Tax=Prolixibacter denitrificans TaxID=1541063 RepID=A0A2P8CGF7_9BACT|nr:DUF4268 domain-containing protein [Prolixibacter denitrificans]PSK84009.1 uncharacterized protein DUF4268 [Prolixibacter denitrificans]GET23551.1 hypothetical protein JCM18694_37970 [Prolixibacter denitrificans]
MYKIISATHKKKPPNPAGFVKYLRNIIFAETFHTHMYTKEEKKELVKRFWTEFDGYCSQLPELAVMKKKWVLHRTKISNVVLKFEVGREFADVILEISHKNEARRLEVYELLEKYRLLLEDGFPEGLIWDFAFERDNGQEVCRIYERKTGFDMHRQKQWNEIFAFFAENMLRLQNNFLDFRDVLKEEILALNRREQ